MKWRPLFLRGKANPRFDELHEDVPGWLRDSLTSWFVTYFPRELARGGDMVPRQEALLAWQRETRTNSEGFPEFNALVNHCRENPQIFLTTCDWLLHHLDWGPANQAAHGLEEILVEAGSAWCVGGEHGDFRLERRAPEGVRESLEEALSSNDRAGKHLKDAWSSAFGRSPNPDHAYDQAVKAVETVAKPVALPKSPKATLGTVISAMSDKPEKWRLSIASRDGSGERSIPRVVDMLRLLWEGHKRHGTADGPPVAHATEEAQAAVVLAATLVHWFGSGHVQTKEDPA